MNEQQIRKIIKDEMQKSYFQLPKIPPHKHNGVDNIKISSSDLKIGNRINSGSITFAQQTQYKIGVNFNPSFVLFYGLAINSGPTVRAHCVGSAFLGNSFYLFPESTTSVTTAKQVQNISQSSTYFSVDNSGNVHALADQTHIVDVEFSATIWARATITAFNNQFLTMNVDNLATGWQIIGNFVIM